MEPVPECPRCGYDLSGAIAASRIGDPNSCPLRSRCSECGLDLWWGDVFRPDRFRLRGFVEHVTWWLAPLAAWRTWAWTLRPGHFWKRVGIVFQPRVGRLLLWAFVVLWGPWFVAGLPSALGGGYALTAARRLIGAKPWLGTAMEPWHLPFRTLGRPSDDAVMNFIGLTPVFVVVGLAMSITFPVVLLCLPMTRAQAKVRARHVLRASVYQLGWLVPVMAGVAVEVVAGGLLRLSIMAWQAALLPKYGGPPPGTFVPPAPVPNYALYMRIGTTVSSLAHGLWFIWLVIFLVWWTRWWWMALRVGFVLGEPRKVWLAGMIPSLISAAIVLAVHPEFLRMLFSL